MRKIEGQELWNVLYKITFNLNYIGSRNVEQSKAAWEKGWGELVSKEQLYPQYYSKYKYGRYLGEYIEIDDTFEINYGIKIKEELFNKYINKDTHNTFVEFGCGTGHNLVHVKNMFPHLKVIGTDWTDAAGKLVKKQGIEFHKFDMLNPIDNLDVDWPNTVVFTMHSMEQLGTNWVKFFEYIKSKKPAIVLHIEPIYELYNLNHTPDFLAALYHYKKAYLRGYLTELSKDKTVDLLHVKKSEIGCMYHDGYSIIAWRTR